MATIDLAAFAQLLKRSLRTLAVAVDLPAADALEVAFALLDEAAHVLRRIAQKQPDLVRERLAASDSLCKAAKAARGRGVRIAAIGQDAL